MDKAGKQWENHSQHQAQVSTFMCVHIHTWFFTYMQNHTYPHTPVHRIIKGKKGWFINVLSESINQKVYAQVLMGGYILRAISVSEYECYSVSSIFWGLVSLSFLIDCCFHIFVFIHILCMSLLTFNFILLTFQKILSSCISWGSCDDNYCLWWTVGQTETQEPSHIATNRLHESTALVD